MPNIKIPPKTMDPAKDPTRKWSEKRAKEVLKKNPLEFSSEGARKDYERAIASNPNNIYGAPPFFPPLNAPSRARGVVIGVIRDGQYINLEEGQ